MKKLLRQFDFWTITIFLMVVSTVLMFYGIVKNIKFFYLGFSGIMACGIAVIWQRKYGCGKIIENQYEGEARYISETSDVDTALRTVPKRIDTPICTDALAVKGGSVFKIRNGVSVAISAKGEITPTSVVAKMVNNADGGYLPNSDPRLKMGAWKALNEFVG
jgi:hypothetical protein